MYTVSLCGSNALLTKSFNCAYILVRDLLLVSIAVETSVVGGVPVIYLAVCAINKADRYQSTWRLVLVSICLMALRQLLNFLLLGDCSLNMLLL